MCLLFVAYIFCISALLFSCMDSCIMKNLEMSAKCMFNGFVIMQIFYVNNCLQLYLISLIFIKDNWKCKN